MTVRELIEAGTFCDSAEIVVREDGHGKWIQGYRIGKGIKMFPCEHTIEFQETIDKKGKVHKYGKHIDGRQAPWLTTGEIRDVYHSINLPMKLIKKDVDKLPDIVANLQVCSFQPRHIPSFHQEQLTHNEFCLEINCYPAGFCPELVDEKLKDKASNEMEGQLSLLDMGY